MANNPYSDDKFKLSHKFFLIPPHGVVVVRRSNLTGKMKKVNGSELGITKMGNVIITWFPWIKTKYVTSLSKTLDYTEGNYITKDRVNLTVDLSAEVRIVDPVKYEEQTSTISERLKNVIDGAVRRTIINYTADEILNSNFDLNALVRPVLDNFKDTYGVEVIDITLQNIKFSSDVSKIFEDEFTAVTKAKIIRETGRANAYVQEMMDDLSIRKSKADAGVEVSKAKALSEISVGEAKAKNDEEFKLAERVIAACKGLGPEELGKVSELLATIVYGGDSNPLLNVRYNGNSTNPIVAAPVEEGKTKTR